MLVWTVQSKSVSDFFTSCAVMDKRRIHATMWLFMELSSRPAIRLPLMDNGLLMEKVINDKRRLLAATVQSSWCYTTLDLSLHLPGADARSLALGIQLPTSTPPSIWRWWAMAEDSSLLSITKLWNPVIELCLVYFHLPNDHNGWLSPPYRNEVCAGKVHF